jgi:hypothetical protein
MGFVIYYGMQMELMGRSSDNVQKGSPVENFLPFSLFAYAMHWWAILLYSLMDGGWRFGGESSPAAVNSHSHQHLQIRTVGKIWITKRTLCN